MIIHHESGGPEAPWAKQNASRKSSGG